MTTASSGPTELTGPPVLSVRVVRPRSEVGALDDLPAHLLTPDGWLFTVTPPAPVSLAADADTPTATPVLPAVTARALDPAAVSAVLVLARKAGLDVPPADTALPEGARVGLETAFSDPETGILSVQRKVSVNAATEKLLAALRSPERELTGVGSAVVYAPTRLRIWAEADSGRSGEPWPLSGYPLAALSDCAGLSGGASADLIAALSRPAVASASTRSGTGLVSAPFRMGQGAYLVRVRILLPGEVACPFVPR